jgi:hypothetical protein
MKGKKLFIALQTASVEMKIKSEPDCSGKSETLTAVFIRHDTRGAEGIRKQMAEIQSKVYVDAVDIEKEVLRLQNMYDYLPSAERELEVETGKARFLSGKTIAPEGTSADSLRLAQEESLRRLLRSQIIALKNVPLEIQDTDETGKVSYSRLVIPDTRTAVDNEELWGEGANCLSALLDALLVSNPWSSSLARAQQNVLYNLQLLSDSVSKN